MCMLSVNVSVIDICDTVIDLDMMDSSILCNIVGVLVSISFTSSAASIIEVNLSDLLEDSDFVGVSPNDRPIIGKQAKSLKSCEKRPDGRQA